MKIGRVSTLTREDTLTLSILWPEALEFQEHEGWRPPMDDYEVADNLGDLPEWVVDKYEVLRRIAPDDVGIDCPPAEFPVVEKPRINPEGLAVGTRPYRVCYPRQGLPKGYLWQRRWYGYHYSIDVAVWNGWPSWQIVVQGLPAEGDGRFGQFAAWSIWPDSTRRGVEAWGFRKMIESLGLLSFCGMMNVEMIEDFDEGALHVVEVHFRPSRCFGPVYGPAARKRILAAAAGDGETHRPKVEGGTVIPRPVRPPAFTATGDMLGDKPGWRAGVEFYG